MQLLLDTHRQQLLANGARAARGEDIDPYPVVKLFTPDAGATWLLTELDPEDPDIAFGLCRAQHKPNYVEHRIMLCRGSPAPVFAALGSDRFT